jgi:hypothetical protein
MLASAWHGRWGWRAGWGGRAGWSWRDRMAAGAGMTAGAIELAWLADELAWPWNSAMLMARVLLGTRRSWARAEAVFYGAALLLRMLVGLLKGEILGATVKIEDVDNILKINKKEEN